MLTVTEIEAYRENGYLVVADVIPPDWVAKARAKLAELIEASRRVSASDSIYDLKSRAHRRTPGFAGSRTRTTSAHAPVSQWRWHLDEVFVKVNGKLCCLWRAIDHEGEVLEAVVTAKRDKTEL